MTYRSLPLALPLALVVAAALSACPTRTEPQGCKGLVAGDLVITEYMNNPDGTDSGKEWFEVYNATAKEVDLAGVTIGFAKVDGSAPKNHNVTAGKIPAEGYFVFGDAEEASKPTWVDYTYGTKLGASGMANSSGSIFIKCGAVKVDEVTWSAASPSGKASALDGKLPPDSAANDNSGNWCAAATRLEGNDYGTPGEPNDACTSSANCIGGDGATRTAVSPKEGELVITEFMAKPASAISDTGEWIEVLALADVDLNGVTVSNGSSKKSVLAANECLSVARGTYFLLAKTEDPTKNGGLPAPAALFTFDLTNDPSSPTDISLKKDGTLIDQVWYDSSSEGVSAQLDACKADPYGDDCTGACKLDQTCPPAASANDNTLAFCKSEAAWGATTEKGSPGAANAPCATAADIKKCTEAGVERDVVRPGIGDVVITELMPKPTGAADLQSWFEVHTKTAIDLNGLELSNGSSKMVIAPRECLTVAAGSYLVFARSSVAFENGGINDVTATYGFSLSSSGGTLTLSLDDGLVVLDSIAYLPPLSGQSISLDPGKLDATENDDPVAFCPGTLEYGNAANKGTPGTANPACPPVVDPTKCMDGDAQRDSLPPAVGSLVVTEIMASPSGSDDVQEWFEVYVRADADLNGLVLSNGTTSAAAKTTISDERCLRVTRGSYLVFGRATDPTINGGIFDMAGVFGFSLSASGSVVLKHGVDTIDYALYASAPAGKALQLGAPEEGSEPDAAANDAPAAFCAATEAYGPTNNKGSPGAANGECAPPIDPEHCTDAGEANPRAVVKPAAGDLVISEVMSNPRSPQSSREWIEVYFKNDVDLNGVELVVGSSGTARYKVLDTACIRPGAGGYAVLARSADPLVNGGMADVVATFDSDLPATGTTPVSLVRDGQLIDMVTYPAQSGSGYSQQLASTKLDAALNDQGANWCLADAAATYGDGDHGTPGTANGACLCAGTSCDAQAPCNPANGQCECTPTSCTAPDTCDDATKQCVEVDPNQCTDSTTGEPRPIVPPADNDLVVSEYMADPNVVSDANGEWVEVYVRNAVDLNGVELSIGTSKVELAPGAACVRPGADKYVVLARVADSGTNGGISNVLATFSTGLTNGGGQTLTLSRTDQATSVTTTYDTVTTLSSTAGASKKLSEDKLDSTLNDAEGSWCSTASGVTYGTDGNRGTPGAANGNCQ